jgi:cation transport ATPase
MKHFLSSTVLIALLIFTGSFTNFTETPVTIDIKTSAECSMCKERLEKALNLSRGVIESKLNLTTRVVTIQYNPKKTTPDKLRKIISQTGYDADGVKAKPSAYKRLPECCQKAGTSGGSCEPKK